MSTTIRWGILGTGGIAKAFAKDLIAAGLSVAAVGSRTPEAASEFAQRFGIPAAHASYAELVADPTVDIVYVSTPHPFHASNALLALEAGKHVLVEKPFTMNAAEARQVVEFAEERKLLALEAMWTRWLPHMLRIREIIAAGTIGEVRTLIADHTQNLPKDPSHRMNNPALGGGALLDLGIYPVSFAWDLFGKPEAIQAMSSPTETGVDRQTAIVLGYPGGQQALLHAQLDARGPNTAHILGTAGRIEIDAVWYQQTTFRVYDNSGEVIELFDQRGQSRGMDYQAREAEQLIAAKRISGDILPARQSIAIMETLDSIRAQIGLSYPGE